MNKKKARIRKQKRSKINLRRQKDFDKQIKYGRFKTNHKVKVLEVHELDIIKPHLKKLGYQCLLCEEELNSEIFGLKVLIGGSKYFVHKTHLFTKQNELIPESTEIYKNILDIIEDAELTKNGLGHLKNK